MDIKCTTESQWSQYLTMNTVFISFKQTEKKTTTRNQHPGKHQELKDFLKHSISITHIWKQDTCLFTPLPVVQSID